MKILVSTKETQGQRENDFCFVPEGEFVTNYGIVCNRDSDDPDGPCGCRRSFIDDVGHGTTTAKVEDVPSAVAEAQIHSMARACARISCISYTDAREYLDRLCEWAASFPVGTILERRKTVQARQVKPCGS
jgi:hypothetical protein